MIEKIRNSYYKRKCYKLFKECNYEYEPSEAEIRFVSPFKYYCKGEECVGYYNFGKYDWEMIYLTLKDHKFELAQVGWEQRFKSMTGLSKLYFVEEWNKATGNKKLPKVAPKKK